MNFYPWHIGDYHSHTAHLEPLEDIAYRRMLDWLYLHEIPLPEDVEEIARVIRMREHCKCIASVLQEFFTCNAEGYTHPRVIEELEAYRAKSAKRKKAAEARWSKTGASCDASALQTESKCNATNTNTNTITKDAAADSPGDVSHETHKPYTMFIGWQPDKTIGDFAKVRGVNLDPFDPATLNEFCLYWAGSEKERTESQWLNTYLKSLKSLQERMAAQNAKSEKVVTSQVEFVQLHTDSGWAKGL